MVIAAVVLALVASTTALAQGPAASGPQSGTSGFRTLTGPAAANFRVPADVTLIRTWHDARHDLTYRRYQQFVQPFNALVDGAQLTVAERGGASVLVIGAHYPSAAATNRLLVTGKQAVDRVSVSRSLLEEVPSSAKPLLVSTAQLRLDPVNSRLFQRVESGAPGVLVFHDIDAETGAVLDVWSGINEASPGMGTGAKGDRKSLKGEDDALGTSDDLTKLDGGAWKMQSVDGRILTYDAKKSWHQTGLLVITDKQKPAWANDNDWAAAYERAAVDAQFYARLTDSWYANPANVGGFDFLGSCVDAPAGYGPIKILVHYDESPGDGVGYDNAFWDPTTRQFVFGDGDGFSTAPFAGGQDVVSHEMSHRVTQCRAPLRYQGQSGALNEAFSDMIAVTIEQEINEALSTNCRLETGQVGCSDWWVGEDSILTSPFGFRSLRDPDATGQPGHWDDHVCTSSQCFDNGGVHINSTIPTHAFYLMVNGGRNARCSGANDPTANCDVVVPAIPLADAAAIVFAAWGALTETATFCDAHDATVAQTAVLFPGSDLHRAAVELAWEAVGRGQADCHPSPAPLTVSPRYLVIAPGHTGQMTASETGLEATVTAPAVATVNPPTGSTIDIQVPADMADGIYPISVSSASGTRHASAVLIVDGNAPQAEVTNVALPGSGLISLTGIVPLNVTWTAHDAASGLASAQLEQSPDAAPASWTMVTTGTGGTSSATVAEDTQWFRVSATDAAGNSGTSDESGAWGIGRFQEGAAIYKGSWSALPSPQSWGSVRYSTDSGATARFTFTGTDVAWISTKAKKRGKAKVYIDNVLQTQVDLFSTTKLDRRIVFTATGLSNATHTLRIEVMGTANRPRIDIEGFVVLSPPGV
jgi:bacillolysin